MNEIKMNIAGGAYIYSVGYDCKAQKMIIELRNGTLYSYNNVPENVYNEMLNNDSAETYFVRNIKYEYEQEKLSVFADM
jgi:hypothetical protein